VFGIGTGIDLVLNSYFSVYTFVQNQNSFTCIFTLGLVQPILIIQNRQYYNKTVEKTSMIYVSWLNSSICDKCIRHNVVFRIKNKALSLYFVSRLSEMLAAISMLSLCCISTN